MGVTRGELNDLLKQIISRSRSVTNPSYPTGDYSKRKISLTACFSFLVILVGREGLEPPTSSV